MMEMWGKSTKHFETAVSDEAEDERKPADGRRPYQKDKAKAKAKAGAPP
jgi:hypothetical protein